MKKILNRVTITGADDSTEVKCLIELSEAYPFVEWGILMSHSRMGEARYPGVEWLMGLVGKLDKLNLSAHVCGRWVRGICKGDWSMIQDPRLVDVWPVFRRIQLNFSPYLKKIDTSIFMESMRRLRPVNVTQMIFQLGNLNNHLLDIAERNGVNAVPLFDKSGGAGVLPGQWPKVERNRSYCGYAGGLSPDNVEEELKKIAFVCQDGPIWIDVETHVRSDNDRRFDLGKVEAFLKAAKSWVAD